MNKTKLTWCYLAVLSDVVIDAGASVDSILISGAGTSIQARIVR